MDAALNAVFEILSFGAIIVLVVLGLGIIASMMGIFNFAHGEFVLLGAYTTYLVYSCGLPVWLGMLAAPFVLALIGLAVERLAIRRFYAVPIVAMLGTYALGIIIRESVRSLIGGLYISIPAPLVASLAIGGVRLPEWRIAILIITALVMAGSYLLLTRTSFGLRMRAALENPALARASGISTQRIYAISFAFGSALAGLAGALVVPIFSLFADLGLRFLIQGFLAVMLGGVGTFEGPVAGAGVIGVLSAALPWAISPVLADVLVFVIAIVIVKFRPAGLISRGRV
ncbi:MAG TPA: branched-chain amino acid ABC transporter permease [Stellaceae bacterium]|nr:branched-chain amino acid ABC transporter permease [Stellaceae bacterium]